MRVVVGAAGLSLVCAIADPRLGFAVASAFILTAVTRRIFANIASIPRANHSVSWKRSKQLKDEGADWYAAATAGDIGSLHAIQIVAKGPHDHG